LIVCLNSQHSLQGKLGLAQLLRNFTFKVQLGDNFALTVPFTVLTTRASPTQMAIDPVRATISAVQAYKAIDDALELVKENNARFAELRE
jgi:hypothetical protein